MIKKNIKQPRQYLLSQVEDSLLLQQNLAKLKFEIKLLIL